MDDLAQYWSPARAEGEPPGLETWWPLAEASAISPQESAELERAARVARMKEQGLDGWVDPLGGAGRFTSAFGKRAAPIEGVGNFHEGVDIAAPLGTPVYAAAEGTVVFVGTGRYGLSGAVVAIRHTTSAGTYLSTYNHFPLSQAVVSEGQKVVAGQKIASVGNEGRSTGPHLHLGIRASNGSSDSTDWPVIDPVSFMSERGVSLRSR